MASIEARRRSARRFCGVGLLEALGVAERGDGVAVPAGLGLLLGESDQDLGVVGGHRLEPSDRLADRQPANMWPAVSLVNRRSPGQSCFAEEAGGVPAHAEILHGVVPAVDDRQRHRPLGRAQGLVLVGVGLALEHHPARDGERPGDLLGEVHEQAVGQEPPLRVAADEVAPDRIDLPQFVEGLGRPARGSRGRCRGSPCRCSGP